MSVRCCLTLALLGCGAAAAQVPSGFFERRTTGLGLALEVPVATPEVDLRLIPALDLQERHPGRLLVVQETGLPLELDATEVQMLFPEVGDGTTRATTARCADGRKLHIRRSWHSVPRQVEVDTLWLHHVLRLEGDGVILDQSTQVAHHDTYRVVSVQRCHGGRCPAVADAELAAAWCGVKA